MYQEEIVASFYRYNGKPHIIEGEQLYGFIYYFHKEKTTIDADNISKPIWDALISEAYSDDNQIIFRSASVLDLNRTEIDAFNVTYLPDNIFLDLMEMLDIENNILYVEIGTYSQSLIKFGYEAQRKI